MKSEIITALLANLIIPIIVGIIIGTITGAIIKKRKHSKKYFKLVREDTDFTDSMYLAFLLSIVIEHDYRLTITDNHFVYVKIRKNDIIYVDHVNNQIVKSTIYIADRKDK